MSENSTGGDLGFRPIGQITEVNNPDSDLGFIPTTSKVETRKNVFLEDKDITLSFPEYETDENIKNHLTNNVYNQGRFENSLDGWLSRFGALGYAVKSTLREYQKQTPKELDTEDFYKLHPEYKGTDLTPPEELMEKPAEKNFDITKLGKAFWRGLTRQERLRFEDLLEEEGITLRFPGLGLLGETALDPVSYVITPIARGLGKAIKPGVAKAVEITKQMSQKAIKTSPIVAKGVEAVKGIGGSVAKQFKRAFVNSTGIKSLDDLINKYSLEREYLKTQSMKFGIKIRKRMEKLAKSANRSIDDVSTQVVNLIEQPNILPPGASPEAMDLAFDLRKYFSETLTREMKAGVPITALSKTSQGIEYFPRITTEEAKQYLRQAKVGNSKVWNTKLANSLKRKTGDFTLDEFNQLVKAEGLESLGGRSVEQFFMQNPSYASVVRGVRSAKAVTSAEFIRDAGKLFGQSVDDLPWGEYLPDTITKLHPELKELVFDPEVVKEISRTYSKVFNPQEVEGFLKAFDTIQNTWKRWLLSPFPKYHLRNVVGNIWNNYLADVSSESYVKATALQAYRKTGKVGWLDFSGITKNYADDAIREAEKLSVVGRGWYAADIPTTIEKEFIRRTALQKTGDILSLKPILGGGRALGTTLENNARMAHFVDKIDKGGSFVDAAMSVKKFLFDYGDLTVFEKQVMKRLFPFYTWTRKNLPLQLELLLGKPHKFIPVTKALEGRDQEALELLKTAQPSLSERLPIEFSKEKGFITYVPLEGLLPAGDLVKIARPQEIFAELLSPYIKTPTELLMNKSLFTEREIENYDGETQELLRMDIPVKTKYLVTTLLPQSRMINEINKLVRKKRAGQPLNAKEQAFAQTLSSVYKTSLEDLKERAQIKIRGKLKDLQNGYRWAVKNGRTKEAERIKATYDKIKNSID